MSLDNFKRVIDLAVPSDFEAATGAYHKYRALTEAIATRHGYSAELGAAVFAALSPNNDYHGNLRDTHKLLEAAAAGRTLDEFTVSTYGPNKRKAWAIVHGERPLDLIVALKTRNFFLNVYNPDDPYPVTIDGHMVNIWRGKRQNLVGLRGMNDRLYEEVADGVRLLASEVNWRANQMQGLLWLTWRRMHGISRTQQLEMWDADSLAARLGFADVARQTENDPQQTLFLRS